ANGPSVGLRRHITWSRDKQSSQPVSKPTTPAADIGKDIFTAHSRILDAKRDLTKLESDIQSTTKWLQERDFNPTSVAYLSRLKHKKELEEKILSTKQDIAATQFSLDNLIEKFGH